MEKQLCVNKGKEEEEKEEEEEERQLINIDVNNAVFQRFREISCKG